jgi:hypothetical protein
MLANDLVDMTKVILPERTSIYSYASRKLINNPNAIDCSSAELIAMHQGSV